MGACSNGKTIQSQEEIVPELNVSEVYFQELVPGQENGKAYLVLAVVPTEGESKRIVKAQVLGDEISLKKQGERYTGLCPQIYRFEKGEVPTVNLVYLWKEVEYVQDLTAELKEPIYMP